MQCCFFISFALMDTKFYKPDFLPQWLMIGYCSLTVMLWLLNYFFGTNFWSKDNFDILSLVKRWRRDTADLIDLEEIALFLDRLYLSCTIFSGIEHHDWEKYLHWTKEEQLAIFKKYIKPEFHHNIQWEKRVFEDGTSLDIIDELMTQRLRESSVQFQYDITIETISDILRTNQWEWVLFVLWLNRDILYNNQTEKNDGSGHLVICTGIDEHDNCIIYEPIHPRPNPHTIHISRVLQAMTDVWTHSMLMIKDNPLHQ